jgi:alkanesulfonate monooxygenase SsuD/methylene tetrahydromethanopterin reductase-like flavin-dependent oxidoreductase (luciferase family)
MTGGRTVLGVGVGDATDDEFAPFGEPIDCKMLDALEALNLILTGEPVNYNGRYVTIVNIGSCQRQYSARRFPDGSRWLATQALGASCRAVEVLSRAWPTARNL